MFILVFYDFGVWFFFRMGFVTFEIPSSIYLIKFASLLIQSHEDYG